MLYFLRYIRGTTLAEGEVLAGAAYTVPVPAIMLLVGGIK
jgi:hypothetical protein